MSMYEEDLEDEEETITGFCPSSRENFKKARRIDRIGFEST